MKPKSTLRSFLALTGSSLLAISSSHGQTILADTYLTSLNVGSPTTLYSSLNFPSYLEGPLTGSSTLTTTGFFNSILNLTNNGAGNTFTGNIVVDSGQLRITGSPFATTTGGFTAPSMTSGSTITINRAGTLFIDDNAGYTADRFGSPGSRPAVNLAGGTINLNGRNNASSSVQNFGALTVSSGQAQILLTRNSSGNPTLTFSLADLSVFPPRRNSPSPPAVEHRPASTRSSPVAATSPAPHRLPSTYPQAGRPQSRFPETTCC